MAEPVVLKIRIECFDVDYFTNGIELFPWSLVIAHEEVLFASARWELEVGEEPKIDVVLDDIRTAVGRYGDIIPIALYVTGHTDTVGSESDNMALSLGRARAISRYFAKQGLGIPIYYAGEGETGLAVQTADEVSEARNRRASYVLDNAAPPGSRWRLVQ
jgi:outer membrane protein OmpA-like peptidoglycan-associated protein